MMSFSAFIFKKLGVAAASIFKKIFEKVQKFCEFFVKYWWLIIILVIIVIIGLAILVLTVNRNNLGKCIEQGESSLTNNTNFVSVLAYPNDNSFFEVQENNYEHEKDGGKMNALSTLLDGTSIKKNNSSPIIIEITGSWIPWFGDLVTKDNSGRITDTFQRDIATPNKTELCRFRKKTLGSDKFNGTLRAREYYYLENYYKDVDFTKIGANSTLEANTTILDPVLQEPCWIEGGTGLYLGFYGVDGNGFPSHFHHLQANEMVCDPENFLRNHNYSTQNAAKTKAITTFNFDYNDFYNGGDYKEIKGMTYGDYIYQNFSLNYAQARQKAYENCKNGTDIKKCIDNIIKEEKNNFLKTKKDHFLSYKDGYIVYNIRKHEEAMMKANIKEYPQLITKAQQAFKDACYYLKKTDNNQGYNVIDAAKYRFREYPDENRLMADYENNINYKNKEVGKILLLDKYYSDNQGGYSLDFKSGFIVDTTSDKVSISSKFKDIEQFLLGTSKPHEGDDRTDGFIYKVYQNILDSGFETVAKAALALFVAIKGLYVILGFAEMKKKDFILFCIRIAFLFSIVDSNGWAFYNKTFINYFVNAVIGFVDLMAQIFNSVYDLVLPSSIVNNSMKIFEKTPATTNTYEIWRYLTVFDNIFDFLKDPTLHKRIVSLIFVKGNPAIGIIMFLMSYFMLYKFIKAVITSIVPLIIIIAQIAILLPLAPIFLVFMFFQRTETYFKNWVKNMASRSFELIVFFFVLFTTTGLINGKIQEFYSFKMCYRHLYSVKDDASAFKTQKDLIEMNESRANWVLVAVQNVVKFVFKTLFGGMIVPIPEGLSNISLLAILLNFLVLYFLIFMYSTINSSITQLMTKIFSFKDPQDKNDKGKFENAGSGLVGDKHNKLTYNVFDRLADMGGRSIIEGASSIFSTDEKGKHIPRISTNNSFLKNIGGVFKMGKDATKGTINFVDTTFGGRIFNQQRRKLDEYHRTSPVSRFFQHKQQQLGNFINRFEKFATTGNYSEFKKGNEEARKINDEFRRDQKFLRSENKVLKDRKFFFKNRNLTLEERKTALEGIEIAKETTNNIAANAKAFIKDGKPDYSKNKHLSLFKRVGANWQLYKEYKNPAKYTINSIIDFNKKGIKELEAMSKIKNKYGTTQNTTIDTGLTARFIKEINKKIKAANELLEKGQTKEFAEALASINEKFLNRDTETFMNNITKAQRVLAKNKFKKIDKEGKEISVARIDFSQLISKENKSNSRKQRENTRINVLNMAIQGLASDLIKDGTINEKAIERFNDIIQKADKLNYKRNSDTFEKIAAIQTALTVDSNYIKELNELNKKLKEENVSEIKKAEINNRIAKIQEIRKSFEKTMIGDNIKEIDKTFERQEVLLSKLEAFKNDKKSNNTSLVDIEKEINKTKERLNTIKALREQSSEEAETLYERLMKPLEVQATQTEMMLGINSKKTKTSEAVIEDRINALKKELETPQDEVAKAEINKEIELLKARDINKLSKFYDIKDKFTDKKILVRINHIERIKEANGDKNKLQDAKELLKIQEDLLATQEKLELLRNGDTDILRTKLSNKLETETDRIRKQELKEQIKAIDNNDKGGLQSLEQTLERKEKVADRKNEILKSRENRDLVKENKIETIKERLENEKAALNREAKTATDERRAEIDARRAKVQNDLDAIYKSERREVTNEQLQKHFEANEKFANTELNAMNLEKVINDLPEREGNANSILKDRVASINQTIENIKENPDQLLNEETVLELKKEIVKTIKQTVEDKNQFDADNVLTDNFNMENFAPGTQAEAFIIKMDESAFMVSADAKSFTIVVNDNLYPCQVTEEGTIEIDPMEEQLKESVAILQKANKFNIKMLEYQLLKAEGTDKEDGIKEQLEKAKTKNEKYEKQLNKKVGQQK